MYVHDPPSPKGHLLLAACLAVPALLYVPYNASIMLHAMLTVYVGAWRSVKTSPPTETMTNKEAAKFPIVGSMVLFGLFILFKFLPKDMINTVLALYLVGLGVMVITGALQPFVVRLFPEQHRERILPIPSIPRIPLLTSEPIAIELTPPEAAIAAVASVGCTYYYFSRNWLLNNVLGVAFSLMGIEHMSLGSTQTACILLTGLFVYDIFWVFCTPVMVSVAKNFDAPIKLLFPRSAVGAAAAGAGKNFAMLGLGDIVIPGMFVALMLRYDYYQDFKTRYFQSAFWGYTAGLGTTIVVMNWFQVRCGAALKARRRAGPLRCWALALLPGAAAAAVAAVAAAAGLGRRGGLGSWQRGAPAAGRAVAQPPGGPARPWPLPPRHLQAAQPALLYIVPAILGAVLLHAAAVGQLSTVFHWSEPGGKEAEAEGEAGGADEGAVVAAGGDEKKKDK
jgi:minor histocompatibility antigen H13